MTETEKELRLPIKRGSDWTTVVSAHNTISFNVLIWMNPSYTLRCFVSSLKREIISFFLYTLVLTSVDGIVFSFCR